MSIRDWCPKKPAGYDASKRKEEFDVNNLLDESFVGARDMILNQIKCACARGKCHVLTETGACDKERISDYMEINTGVTKILFLRGLEDSTPDHLLFSWCDNGKKCSEQKQIFKKFHAGVMLSFK